MGSRIGVPNRLRRVRLAAVIGSGPAGLFAAQRLEEEGFKVSVFSPGMKSELNGAQYLHRPIPAFNGRVEGVPVEYRLNGDADGYRVKVYGEEATVKVSPETLTGTHLAWDIRTAYNAAWKRWKGLGRITSGMVDGRQIPYMLKEFKLVVNTAPLRGLCLGGHAFESSTIYASGDAPGNRCPVRVEEMTVQCDGTRERGWYRASNVFGFCTVEYPGGKKPPIALARVTKPIRHGCTCFPGLINAGRYGSWTKGVLSDSAYWDLPL